MYPSYVDGVLREKWDDDARKVTFYGPDGKQTLQRDYTPAEIARAASAAEAAARVSDLGRRVELLERAVFGAPGGGGIIPLPSEGDAKDWAAPCAPNTVILWKGTRMRNVSGAWLTATPDTYPIGYVTLGTPAPAWAVGVTYKTGDQVTYNAVKYQCLQAHTSQAGWTPDVVAALWTRVA